MKNLLIIIHHLDRGGAEKCAANLSNLMKGRYNVHVVIFFSKDLFPISYEYSGKLHCLEQQIAKSPIHKIRNTLQRISALRKLKKQLDIDVSVSYLFNGDFSNILSKGREKIVLALSNFLSANETGFRKYLIKRFYNKADRIIALNERGRKDAIENFNVKPSITRTIPNFYDSADILQKYHVPTPDWSATEDYFNFIQVGRFTHAKGQWHLLRIFRQILNEKPYARLLIVGIGEMKNYLLEYANQLGMNVQDFCDTDEKIPDLKYHQVVFLGYTTNPFKYLRIADAFLFTSIYEGFPNALSEAMICGMPVFSTDCTTGPRELIAPDQSHIQNYPLQTKYGVLFPPFDGEQIDADTPILEEEQLWIDTLQQYIDNTKLFGNIGENAQKRMQEFDKENVKRMWIETLNE